jgi:hypothetical protein
MRAGAAQGDDDDDPPPPSGVDKARELLDSPLE